MNIEQESLLTLLSDDEKYSFFASALHTYKSYPKNVLLSLMAESKLNEDMQKKLLAISDLEN